MMNYQVTMLDAAHDVKNLDCGDSVLNNWLSNTARQHQKNGTSKTYVLVDEQQPTLILGFITLALRGLMATQELPPEVTKKLPRIISGFTLARLAVSKTHQRKGLGGELLLSAMEKVKAAAEVSGFGFFVDAKDEGAAAYYRQFGFLSFPSNPLILVMPIADIPVSA